MISVDNRAGSIDIAPVLRTLGVEVDLTRMAFGDIAWIGTGPNQVPVNVGVELKSLSDCIACLTSGRFAGHQLPGLVKSYDHVYLLIYGEYERRRTDDILVERKYNVNGSSYLRPAGGGRRLFRWRDFESWLMSMSVLGGIRLVKVPNMTEAAQWVKMASNWYAREEHKSHQVVYSSKEIYADYVLLEKPPLARRIAKELPHIGLKRSAVTAQHFETMFAMANASESEWRNLRVDNGKKLGSRGAIVYNAIRGHKNGTGHGGHQ